MSKKTALLIPPSFEEENICRLILWADCIFQSSKSLHSKRRDQAAWKSHIKEWRRKAKPLYRELQRRISDRNQSHA